MKPSELAWQRIEKLFKAITVHGFNQDLIKGVLEEKKFNFFIEQDCIFLKALGESFKLLANRSSNEELKNTFLKYSKGCFRVEEEIVRPFISDKTILTSKQTLACMSFCDHLILTCSIKPIELGIATTLPCYWIYHELGRYIRENTVVNNKYAKWISTYSRETFSKNVNNLKMLFDEFSNNSSTEVKSQMIEEFYTTSALEWHFWNDAYKLKQYDSIVDL
ncbi:MAG: tenA [Rickettsiaceae bacterium]|jgi:thiaminase/transcriptional activator TenA|nr:tenA [Rickettsiaceae bacterium]